MIWDSAFRRARRYLGVEEGDPEFPPVAYTDAASDVIDRLQQDCAGINENLLLREATLQPDTSGGRVYSCAAQAEAITNLMRAMAVRLNDAGGPILDELPLSQVDAYRGLCYALLGPEVARVLQLSSSAPGGRPLHLRYLTSSQVVTSHTDTVPAFVPDGYADLLGLMVAEMLWPQGGEQSMPREQAERLEDRLGQLYDRWGRSTPTVARRRMSGDGEAPHLF